MEYKWYEGGFLSKYKDSLFIVCMVIMFLAVSMAFTYILIAHRMKDCLQTGGSFMDCHADLNMRNSK